MKHVFTIVDFSVSFFFFVSSISLLFKRQDSQELSKVDSDESHEVLKTVASLNESLDFQRCLFYLYIY